jgi:hypothetical protein
MSEPIAYLYRSAPDQRYYVFCMGCWEQYGPSYMKNSRKFGEQAGIWAVYPEHIESFFHLACSMGRWRSSCKGTIGSGEISLFDSTFLVQAYRNEDIRREISA